MHPIFVQAGDVPARGGACRCVGLTAGRSFAGENGPIRPPTQGGAATQRGGAGYAASAGVSIERMPGVPANSDFNASIEAFVACC